MQERYNLVIATRNSEGRIQGTLESLAIQLSSSGELSKNIHVIIANNNSTDKTREILDSYTQKLPLTVIDVGKDGKSAALNVAIKDYVDADVILFSDDDVIFEDGWLNTLTKAIRENPQSDIFAGHIKGYWEKELPKEIKDWRPPLGACYAIHTDRDSGACDPGLVWGPNMAVRKRVFDSGIYFDEGIGPQSKKMYPMGQDTEFAKRAARNGFKCFFVSESVVGHVIEKERACERWMLQRARRLGYGVYFSDIYEGQENIRLFMGAKILAQYIFWMIIYPGTFLMKPSKHKFWSQWKYHYYGGMWKGFCQFG